MWSNLPKLPPSLLAEYARPKRAPPIAAQGDHVSPELLAEMLKHIPAEDFGSGADPSWLDFAMACHAATGGAGGDVFATWSAGDTRYQGLYDVNLNRWNSFRDKPGGITSALLYKELEKRGVRNFASILFANDNDRLDFDELLEELSRAEPSEQQQSADGAFDPVTAIGLMTASEYVQKIKPAKPILEGLLYQSGIATCIGAKNLGKTAIFLDLCFSITNGKTEWQGRRLFASGPVMYFAAEGWDALTPRIQAWEKHHGEKVSDRFFAKGGSINLRDAKWRTAIIAAARAIGPVLIVFDTLSSSSPGLQENQQDAISDLYGFARELHEASKGMVVFIHHPAKGSKNAGRGSSVIEDNEDGGVFVEDAGGGLVRFRAQKVRHDAKDNEGVLLKLEKVELYPDPENPEHIVSGPVVLRADKEADFMAEIADLLSGYNGSIGLTDPHLMTVAGRHFVKKNGEPLSPKHLKDRVCEEIARHGADRPIGEWDAIKIEQGSGKTSPRYIVGDRLEMPR
jgi:hypothetical protein